MDPLVINMISKFIRDMGIIHFAYRCNREATLNSLLEIAIAKTGRTANRVHADDPEDPGELPIAVPDDDNFPPRRYPTTPHPTPQHRISKAASSQDRDCTGLDLLRTTDGVGKTED